MFAPISTEIRDQHRVEPSSMKNMKFKESQIFSYMMAATRVRPYFRRNRQPGSEDTPVRQGVTATAGPPLLLYINIDAHRFTSICNISRICEYGDSIYHFQNNWSLPRRCERATRLGYDVYPWISVHNGCISSKVGAQPKWATPICTWNTILNI